ncbi:hypothetical protein Poli38472_008657 [Pythium oligandrum]|uniref:Cytochrome b5 heme-binding domain-containing protein n=1 Tax=Pythium oligandrum TaxID=41045 RepID=A0A8K1FCN7_PYTOL|nr:hypothetical protein Poli38472_008657 [Pythium oligandrum]|eukprot:TMW56009.1 hypothetical protein Poli38472_008657 [Pythium oligandrum]
MQSHSAMTKEPNALKTRTGNALVQFLFITAVTGVAYQFLTSRHEVDVSTSEYGGHRMNALPWNDAAALKRHRASRETVSTTEFSCFMACIGLFGLMQRKKQRDENERIETMRAIKRQKAASTSLHVAVKEQTALALTHADVLSALPVEIQLELLDFIPPQDLVSCAMVCSSWNELTGDHASDLWKRAFIRDFHESGERFGPIFPRICWRQYYFLHHLSRAVEVARLMELTANRKCMVIKGMVYDVTDFLDMHPGGYHVIGDVIGTDATDLWYQFQHSSEARTMMADFLVRDDVLMAQKQIRESETDGVTTKTLVLNGNLASVQRKWDHISWYLAHAHIFGGLSSVFLDVSLRFTMRNMKGARRRRMACT